MGTDSLFPRELNFGLTLGSSASTLLSKSEDSAEVDRSKLVPTMPGFRGDRRHCKDSSLSEKGVNDPNDEWICSCKDRLPLSTD